jgi:hypothetical protein
VDALNRAVQAVTVDRTLTRGDVKAGQGTDKFCLSLEVGRPEGKTEYFIDQDGIIFRRRKNGEHQLVVPETLVRKVISLNHNPIFVAHPGQARTLNILCLRYYWRKMRRDVQAYIQNGHECQQTKPRHEFRAPMGEVLEPSYPFQVTAMDILNASSPVVGTA